MIKKQQTQMEKENPMMTRREFLKWMLGISNPQNSSTYTQNQK
jgi:hypothetical protein